MSKIEPVILIVDDNELDRRFLTSSIRRVQPRAKLLEAQSVSQAIESMQKNPCDLVFLDMHLGRENASEILNRFPAKTRNFPIIMLTSDRTEATMDLAFECGADDFIGKPLEFELLETKTTAALQGRAVSSLSYFGRREGLAPATLNTEVQLVYLSEFTFILLAPFSIPIESTVRIFWHGFPLPLTVREVKKTNDPNRYMIQGDLLLENIPDEQRITLRKSLLK